MDAKTLARKAAWREANREKIRERDRALYQKRKTKVLEQKKKYYAKNADQVKARVNTYYKDDPEYVKARVKQYRKKNPQKIAASNAKRRADEIQRTPRWADLKKIEEFYKNCPKGLTVDHIIPLRGKNISGLHVHTNLQYLTRSENSRKNNRY